MNKFGHIFVAAVLFTAIYYLISLYYPLRPEYYIVALVICLIYSLIPDLDKGDSWIKKKLDLIILYAIIILGIFYFVNQDLIYPIILLIGVEVILLFTKHRGFLHSFAFAVLIASPMLLISWVYFVAAILGILSHLLMDQL
jgi:membrane-bound metal-dependent hydrolase YbcI (DUF457 family)